MDSSWIIVGFLLLEEFYSVIPESGLGESHPNLKTKVLNGKLVYQLTISPQKSHTDVKPTDSNTQRSEASEFMLGK